MTAPLSWVVGRGGLLGSQVERAVDQMSQGWHPALPIDWTGPRRAAQLASAVDEFTASAAGRTWWISWCAGAGVVGSTHESLATETASLRLFLGRLGGHLAAGRIGRGCLFVASSAGGVYAGSREAPFDETTQPRPISRYGEEKLRQERLAMVFSATHRVPVLVGRISNLYGPGQDLRKAQGLISQLCRSQLSGEVLHLYVPLDTLRDYLFAEDCGRMVARGLAELDTGSVHSPVVKVLASQRPTTIGYVLSEFLRVTRRAPKLALGNSPLSALQVRDLRLRSTVHRSLDMEARTLLPVGLDRTFEDLRQRLARPVAHER